MIMINVFHRLRVKGVREVSKNVLYRLLPPKYRVSKLFCPHDYDGDIALEIGNFSSPFAFGGPFPVYERLAALDRVLKSGTTPWTKWEREYPCHLRRDFITCATELEGAPRGHYGTVLSCHVLEHIANPLKALLAWREVLKPGGKLVLMLPRRTLTGDHAREQTVFAHLLDDYKNNTKESDLTHIEDFCRNDDLRMFTGVRFSDDEIVEMASRHEETGTAHLHTWDGILALLSLRWAGFRVTKFGHHPPFHIILVAINP